MFLLTMPGFIFQTFLHSVTKYFISFHVIRVTAPGSLTVLFPSLFPLSSCHLYILSLFFSLSLFISLSPHSSEETNLMPVLGVYLEGFLLKKYIINGESTISWSCRDALLSTSYPPPLHFLSPPLTSAGIITPHPHFPPSPPPSIPPPSPFLPYRDKGKASNVLLCFTVQDLAAVRMFSPPSEMQKHKSIQVSAKLHLQCTIYLFTFQQLISLP